MIFQANPQPLLSGNKIGSIKMGSVRTLLAIAVVFAHSYGFVFTGGKLAVQVFYIISGYLISLILLSNPSYLNLKNFYMNRWLRLFPIYLLVAFLSLTAFTLSYYMGNDLFFYIYEDVGLKASILLVISNIFIIGQDLVFLTGVSDGVFGFTTDFTQSEIPVWNGLLVPQAWTLSLEILFYVIAPFILKDKKVWLTLMFLSLILRGYLIHIGIGNNSFFSHRFFPTELALFLFGALSHQIIKPAYQNLNILENSLIMNTATATSILFVIFYFLIPVNRIYLELVLIIFIMLTLPFLANFQKKFKIDNFIGSLSYPIYIGHILIISVISFFGNAFNFKDTWIYIPLILSSTIVFAFFLEILINQKIDKLRTKIRNYE